MIKTLQLELARIVKSNFEPFEEKYLDSIDRQTETNQLLDQRYDQLETEIETI
jgi:hypothetical protein